jgi:feruloyl esterase
MRTIYGGPRNTDGKLFPGYPLGGELSEGGMSAWLTGGLRHNGRKAGDTDDNGNPVPVIPNLMFGFGNGVMKHMVFNDPNWSYASYDYDNFLRDSAAMEKVLNATNPDLDAFRDRGGKLLMYHGWSDTALSALATIEYYETVTERDPSASDDMILYLLPGVDHCIGGEGPSLVNYLTEIDKWVESGDAPGELKAQWLHWMLLPWGSRLVCPYPQQLKYDGAGSTSDSGSFSCVSPGT